VEWRVYPADLLDVAVKKGEIHAIADGDPNLYLIEKRNPGVFTELGNSATGEYAEKICCVLGAGAKFVRDDRKSSGRVVRALAQASDYVAENPNESAKIFAKYTPKFEVPDLQRLIAELTYKHHPHGSRLQDEVREFAADFRAAGILKKSTDPARAPHHPGCAVMSTATYQLAPQAGAPILQPATPTAAPSTTATAVAAAGTFFGGAGCLAPGSGGGPGLAAAGRADLVVAQQGDRLQRLGVHHEFAALGRAGCAAGRAGPGGRARGPRCAGCGRRVPG
jgi:hypothetical protein